MIENCFHRTVECSECALDVVCAEGGPHVSVYCGPFAWQIAIADLSPVIRLLAFVLLQTRRDWRPLQLDSGDPLHVGIGPEKTHVWVSSAVAHLRIPVDTAQALLAALSEARFDIERRAAAAKSAAPTERTPA